MAIPATGVKCKEDPVSTKATQEIVIRIFSNACAEAAQVCRDQINKAYPDHCEEIIAAKIRQIDEDDSSTDDEVISKNMRKEPGPNTFKNSEETAQVLRKIHNDLITKNEITRDQDNYVKIYDLLTKS